MLIRIDPHFLSEGREKNGSDGLRLRESDLSF